MHDGLTLHASLCQPAVAACHKASLFLEVFLFPTPLHSSGRVLVGPVFTLPWALHHRLLLLQGKAFLPLLLLHAKLFLLEAYLPFLLDISQIARGVLCTPEAATCRCVLSCSWNVEAELPGIEAEWCSGLWVFDTRISVKPYACVEGVSQLPLRHLVSDRSHLRFVGQIGHVSLHAH